MSPTDQPDLPPDKPALYEIRVRGALDKTWCSLMDQMSLSVVRGDAGQPVTVIRVTVQDQAALAGLLDALFTLNTTVLSVEAIEVGRRP